MLDTLENLIKLARERKLDFYVYAIATDLGLIKHEQEHELAKLLGLKVIKHNKSILFTGTTLVT